MVNIVTYHSTNAKPSEAWLAFIILPNGERLMVHFIGDSEEAVTAKAASFYEKEISRFKTYDPIAERSTSDKPPSAAVNPWATPVGRGAHFAGKAWLIHKVTRVKIRVPYADVDKYLEYERGGPRSK